MPNRSSNPDRRDVNQVAAAIMEETSARAAAPTPSAEPDSEQVKEKDAAAVALGRRGGLKGGRARAERLTPEERREIAKKAAAARWRKNGEGE